MTDAIDDPLVSFVFNSTVMSFPYVRAAIHEIFDADYVHLHHGRRHGANKGCKGPLCAKALRDQQRQRRRESAERAGRTVRSVTRTDEYMQADIELGAFQLAYDRTVDGWKKSLLDPVHTAILVNGIVSSWAKSCFFATRTPIHGYLHDNGLCAPGCKTLFPGRERQLVA